MNEIPMKDGGVQLMLLTQLFSLAVWPRVTEAPYWSWSGVQTAKILGSERGYKVYWCPEGMKSEYKVIFLKRKQIKTFFFLPSLCSGLF